MPSTKSTPHFVTLEAVHRGNLLNAESAAAYDRAIIYGEAIAEFERLKELAWAECRAKREAAGVILMGEARGYRGY